MSKRKVLEVLPKATIESHTGNDGRRYYLVRKRRGEYMYSGSGDTPGAAWRDAWETLLPVLRAAVEPKDGDDPRKSG